MKRSFHADGLLQMLTKCLEAKSRTATRNGFAFDARDIDKLGLKMIALIKDIKAKISELV